MEELAVTITRDAQGQYTVEPENSQEQYAEGGMGAQEGMGEGMGEGVQKARDINEALQMAKSLFESGDNTSAQSLFEKGFGGEESNVPMGKPAMPQMM